MVSIYKRIVGIGLTHQHEFITNIKKNITCLIRQSYKVNENCSYLHGSKKIRFEIFTCTVTMYR